MLSLHVITKGMVFFEKLNDDTFIQYEALQDPKRIDGGWRLVARSIYGDKVFQQSHVGVLPLYATASGVRVRIRC